MKKMTCKQLGGACDLEFQANTFDEIAELSKKHGKEMFEKNDAAHLEAMHKMQELMKNPEDIFDNAVALCPNCHRKMHSLSLKSDIKKLFTKIEKRN